MTVSPRWAASFAVAVLTTAPNVWADVGDWNADYEPPPAVRRSDFMAALHLVGVVGEASGFPNKAAQIGDPEFEAQTGFSWGGGGALWVGVAPRDWFTFAVGLNLTSLHSSSLSAPGTFFGVQVQAFPLFDQGVDLQDLGAFAEFGAGTRNIERDNKTVAEGGFLSVVGFGASYERLRLGNHVSAGPVIEYMHEFSLTLTSNIVLGGVRAVFYGGPG